MADYSYLVLYLPRGTSRDAARQILTDHAEYGNWELSRIRLFPDGSRKATLRRSIIRQTRLGLTPRPVAGWRVVGQPGNSGPPGNPGGPATF
jgi:hypothetical protein